MSSGPQDEFTPPFNIFDMLGLTPGESAKTFAGNIILEELVNVTFLHVHQLKHIHLCTCLFKHLVPYQYPCLRKIIHVHKRTKEDSSVIQLKLELLEQMDTTLERVEMFKSHLLFAIIDKNEERKI